MNTEEGLTAEVRRKFLSALSEAEEAVVNWRSGRMENTAVSQHHFDAMQDASSQVLAIVDCMDVGVEPSLIERMRTVHAQLTRIIQDLRGMETA
jgi:hypothetical protein